MDETWWSNSTNILEDKVEYRLLPENKQIINLKNNSYPLGLEKINLHIPLIEHVIITLLNVIVWNVNIDFL